MLDGNLPLLPSLFLPLLLCLGFLHNGGIRGNVHPLLGPLFRLTLLSSSVGWSSGFFCLQSFRALKAGLTTIHPSSNPICSIQRSAITTQQH